MSSTTSTSTAKNYPNGEIRGQFLASATVLLATLNSSQAAVTGSNAVGSGTVFLWPNFFIAQIQYVGLTSSILNYSWNGIGGLHIHGPAAINVQANPIYDMLNYTQNSTFGSDLTEFDGYLTSLTLGQILNGLSYMNVHTEINPDGEIRGQLLLPNVTAITAPLPTTTSGITTTTGGASPRESGYTLLMMAISVIIAVVN